MARNRKRQTRDWEVLSIFLMMGAFGLAGQVGTVVYDWLSYLFGFGYYLLPAVFLLLAISFLREQERDFAMPQIFGSLVLFLSSLGLVNLFSDKGGIIGNFVSKPLDSYFHIYFSAVILLALVVVSILVIFNTSIKFDAISFIKKFFSKKEIAPLAPMENAAINKAVEIASFAGKGQTLKSEGKMKHDEGFMPMLTRRSGKKWIPPPLSLLEGDRGKPGVGDIKANANLIKRTLMNFGIVVEMDEISIGPSVTRYALKPAEGVKLSRILALQNNLELALAAHPVRIEAPIPGKSLVGIEVPNTLKSIIGLGSLISDEQYTRSALPLLVSLGRDIAGRSHFTNLARMPHLLLAGATGSGKTCDAMEKWREYRNRRLCGNFSRVKALWRIRKD
ncbi:MAG: translocase FtsK protein [Candidatus Yanofskybacteria bacterium GW2011_GWA1_48_10]|uniref:Translocase FtsK protein n=1 Tax=Candidatus Yanofskybacteria bacterium GW2011_GWA1_48_10 TaxID=1619022 RepID=A0A0G1U4H5_9BACT|nr:MAG: translocase FtsK protein [Candidatus Yanofskybacteria bacterium GW2011_GWA1_48_10]